MKKIKTKPGRLVVPKKLKITGVDELITESTIYGEGRKRLTRYAQYVLTQRAVPDYRDGLKVVHRRLMWAMKELGAVHSGKHYKSARVTGDCFVAGTLVATPEGQKRIEELKVGDRVDTSLGIKHVTDLIGNPHVPMYKATFTNGVELVTTRNQEVKVKRGDKFYWISLCDVTPDDDIVTY